MDGFELTVSPVVVMLATLSFVGSVVAAIIALHLYSLLRTGQIGASWRVLIIASVIFAVLQATRLFEILLPIADDIPLSGVVELVFILALVYAFFLQRRLFIRSEQAEIESGEDAGDEEIDDQPTHISPYEKYS